MMHVSFLNCLEQIEKCIRMSKDNMMDVQSNNMNFESQRSVLCDYMDQAIAIMEKTQESMQVLSPADDKNWNLFFSSMMMVFGHDVHETDEASSHFMSSLSNNKEEHFIIPQIEEHLQSDLGLTYLTDGDLELALDLLATSRSSFQPLMNSCMAEKRIEDIQHTITQQLRLHHKQKAQTNKSWPGTGSSASSIATIDDYQTTALGSSYKGDIGGWHHLAQDTKDPMYETQLPISSQLQYYQKPLPPTYSPLLPSSPTFFLKKSKSSYGPLVSNDITHNVLPKAKSSDRIT